ncbi:pseudouridine synthase [Biformimicrobium ophioploci]|uniref:Pseudouridine synthase n=1 Tax=Biformimicrobium ophioploci TaxID=3036711 RepID=A0ABQ6M1L6_9GAMM|nr:pseudouridine synthase [Microbulbifer sp. NKW57]GMG88208.1 rRNA large subunit pseudouridine synthase E [Microbulbifer sp. NKW57]
MSKVLLFNKPYNVLSQFTDERADGSARRTLAEFISRPGYYAAGRLDYDSEGLLILTDDGQLQQRISNPRNKLPKTYWVQVEGLPDEAALRQLRQGVLLKDGPTAPAKAAEMAPPAIWPRKPPIRERRDTPTCWIELTITEGRNRQVRRMTAAVGHPTLRLVRAGIGHWTLGSLQPGEYREETVHLPTSARQKPVRKHRQRR